MADFTIRREVLERVFGQKDAARAFENQQAMLASVASVQTSNVADTAKLNDAAFVTLSANAELPNERVLQLGDGLEMIVGDTTVLIRVNDDTARATGGHRVTFIATGDTNVAVPLTGVLASREWVQAQGYSTASASGTVTSVSGAGTVSGLTLTGTVTTTGNLTLGGTLAVTPANFASQTANTVLAAPVGAAGAPTFRALAAADIPTLNQSTTGSAATLTTGRTIGMTGDVAWTSASFNGSGNVTGTSTLATVNANVGTFGSSSLVPVITVNAKGLVTGVSTTALPSAGPTAYMYLLSAYTLTNTAVSQKLFNVGASSGGAITLSTGIYVYELFLHLTAMSATSGNGVVNIIGAGTANPASARALMHSIGIDATTLSTAATQSGAWVQGTTAFSTNMVTAATGTAMGVRVSGVIDITSAGTIIPSISLTTAAAAIVSAGSYFQISRVGTSATAYTGSVN